MSLHLLQCIHEKKEELYRSAGLIKTGNTTVIFGNLGKKNPPHPHPHHLYIMK